VVVTYPPPAFLVGFAAAEVTFLVMDSICDGSVPWFNYVVPMDGGEVLSERNLRIVLAIAVIIAVCALGLLFTEKGKAEGAVLAGSAIAFLIAYLWEKKRMQNLRNDEP
jgi:hypothetical protein